MHALSEFVILFYFSNKTLWFFTFSYIDFTLICQGDDPYFNKLIRILATRCMTQVTPLE
jgi:hypothetical protein